MAVETFPDGSTITFDEKGCVRAVSFSAETEHVFSENKSLRQLALDLQHELMSQKHKPKPAPAPETPA